MLDEGIENVTSQLTLTMVALETSDAVNARVRYPTVDNRDGATSWVSDAK